MDYGETDRIVTLFTREYGKIRGIARHGKKSVRRFGGALEVFARIRAQLVVKEGLSGLRAAEPVTVFPRIRGELARICYAGYACEVTDRLLPEAMRAPRLYRLLSAYLDHLDAAEPAADDRRFFEVNLLNILGYRISLESCSRCGAGIAGTALFTATGEILCRGCGRNGPTVGPEARSLLGRAMEVGRFGMIRFSAEALSDAGALLDAALSSHLNRPLHSLPFLRDVLGVH
jgi:DNA repair protein RecO (recombination protein O)